MTGGSSINISQEPDVVGYVSGRIGQGSALGAIYSRLPGASEAIDDLTLALARHVLHRQLPNCDPAPRDKWIKDAYDLIEAQQPPLPAGYSTETNVDRLIRWVDRKCERFLIGVVPPLDAAGVRNAHSVAEWMHRVSHLPTLVVHGSKVASPRPKPAAFKSSLERKLSARLDQDAELRGIFEANVCVVTVFQTKPAVDFVWRQGRMIVEIDGYHFHSAPDQFAGDRQRDYETGASGYLTLRLTDHEVSQDLDLVVQKIRRYVRLRKKLFHV